MVHLNEFEMKNLGENFPDPIIVNFDDLFLDNRSAFVGVIRVQDDPFALRVKWFLLLSGIFQFRDMTIILVLLLQLVDPSS